MILHYSVTHLLEPGEGPLRGIDPRLKLATVFWLLLLVVTVPAGELPPLRRLLSALILLVVVSRVSWQNLVLRLLPLLPFALLVLFIPFMHGGHVLWQLPLLPGAGIAITAEGVSRALEVGARMGTLGLALAILSATTPAPALLDALRAFHVPASVVQTLEFLFRYLFLLLEEAGSMRRAWSARGGDFAATRGIQQSLGSLLATLFVRTYGRGERVLMSMLARGYDPSLSTRTSTPLPRQQLPIVFLVWGLLAVIRFVT